MYIYIVKLEGIKIGPKKFVEAFYVGQTTKTVEERMREHRSGKETIKDAKDHNRINRGLIFFSKGKIACSSEAEKTLLYCFDY